MKKNLRIVSAAAAALLAVAPVAATVVPAATAQAAVNAYTTVKSDNTADAGSLDVNVTAGTQPTFNRAVQDALTEQVGESLNAKGSVYLYDVHAGEIHANKQTVTFKVANNKNWKNGTISANGSTSNGMFWNKKTQLASKADSDNDVITFTVTVNYNITEKPAVSNEGVDSSVYFARWDGRELANDATVVANNDQNNVLFINGKGNMRSSVTLAELKVAIENVLTLRNNKNEKASWSKNVWNNATSDDNLISQLRHAGFTVTGSGDKASFKPGSTQFTINVKALNGATANVVFQNSYAPDTVSPVIMGNYNGSWEPVRTPGGYIRPIIVSQNDLGNNSAWNPYDYLRADANSSTKAWINADYSGDKVDLTKAGVYNVTVKATNAANKTTTETVPVIVSDINGKVMTVVNNAPVYAINNGVATQATGLKTLPVGSQVKVFGSVVTAKLNGQDTQFYRIVTPKANYFVRASDLKDGVVSTPAQETTKTVTIMHISTIYDKNGKATHEPALRAYDTYSVVSTPVNLKDEKGNDAGKFYKLAGKDQYIKVGNVDGTSRSLKHNSYVYKSTGKRRGKTVLKKGSSVTTYGKSFMIAGHQMYRIGENQYVKKANF